MGSRLAEFRILRVLGRGGFGIVYLAHDDSLGRQVAIKEYLPAMWAGRGRKGRVGVHDPSFADDYASGLASFVNEARLLARFDHPSLVKVHRFWEAQGTAYMVMPYYQGVSLRQLRDSMSDPPDEAWQRRLLDGLLGALEVMHAASVCHRDVAPDNILLLPSGRPVLLDFGAARHVVRGQAQALTAVLKPSYAPIEQYAADSEVHQGPWTDIYAVAATLHYSLTGKAPPTSAARAVHDRHLPLLSRQEFGATSSTPGYDSAWLGALDWGLAVMPQARPQNIAQWRAALSGRWPVPPTAIRPVDRKKARPGSGAWVAAAGLATLVALSLAGGLGSPRADRPAPSPGGADASAPGAVAVLAAVQIDPAIAVPQPLQPSASAAVELAHEPVAAALPKPRAVPAEARARASRTVKKVKPAATTSPQQLCAKLGWFSRFNCIRKACATPRWDRHPQCRPGARVGQIDALPKASWRVVTSAELPAPAWAA